MTREMTVTLDKNDLVQEVKSTGSRWRFQRIRPLRADHGKRKLTEEQEQAICAMYVDRPNMTTVKIGETFGVVGTTVSGVIKDHGITPRRKRHQKSEPVVTPRRAPTEAQIAAQLSGSGVPDPRSTQDTRPVWRVTLVRRVIEEVHADTLLDVAAHFDGQDVEIVKAERA